MQAHEGMYGGSKHCTATPTPNVNGTPTHRPHLGTLTHLSSAASAYATDTVSSGLAYEVRRGRSATAGGGAAAREGDPLNNGDVAASVVGSAGTLFFFMLLLTVEYVRGIVPVSPSFATCHQPTHHPVSNIVLQSSCTHAHSTLSCSRSYHPKQHGSMKPIQVASIFAQPHAHEDITVNYGKPQQCCPLHGVSRYRPNTARGRFLPAARAWSRT